MRSKLLKFFFIALFTVIMLIPCASAGYITYATQDFGATEDCYFETIYEIDEPGFDTYTIDQEGIDTVMSFGLTVTHDKDAIVISGTPTKAGTLVLKAHYTDGVNDMYITITGHIKALEVTVARDGYTCDAEMGEYFRENVIYGSSDYTWRVDESSPNTLWEYGLDVSNEGSIWIVGTPIKTGTATVTFVHEGKTRIIYRTINVSITEPIPEAPYIPPEEEIKPEFITEIYAGDVQDNGDVKLLVVGSGRDFIKFTLYVNTIPSIEGATEVYPYLGTAIIPEEPEKQIYTTVPYSQEAEMFYYFVKARSGEEEDLYSSFAAVENPNYVRKYNNPFPDIKESDWFYEDVLKAYEMGLINGKNGKYVPDGNLKICEAIKIAACMHELYHTDRVTLTNATSGNWYDSYVDYAIANNIITWGQFNGKYDKDATRADYVNIFANSLPDEAFEHINPVEGDAIPDVKKTDFYCSNSVYKFYRAGILTGSGNQSTFRYFFPDRNISRSEVAVIITRIMDPSARQEFSLIK